MTNANAIRAISSAVEGTIGPKGLDTMLVDKFGDVVITNDGVTILNMMEANHPAARMLINTAKAQQGEIGDGTTTATIMASSLINEGVSQVAKGVPVARVIEGIRLGSQVALGYITEQARIVDDLSHPLLMQVAMIAGRDHADIAKLVTEAAQMIGHGKLQQKGFKLSDTVTAQEGAENQVFTGATVNKQRISREMPREVIDPKILIIDDALEPEKVEDEALSTESGFNQYIEYQRQFSDNLKKIGNLGVKLVLVDRGISDLAEEILIDQEIMVLQRVSAKELRKVAEHTGARPIKRTGLKRSQAELEKHLGTAKRAVEDEKLEQVFVHGGLGKPMATILVGATTKEVVGERERIAKDAAASVQAAIKGGIVPGGGAIELAAALRVEEVRKDTRGMAAYGVDCVANALKQPFNHIVANAGYNALEKLGDALAAQSEKKSDCIAIDCDTGVLADMWQLRVVDPVLVKIYAIKAAAEVAQAILRIDTIIKMKEELHEDDGVMTTT